MLKSNVYFISWECIKVQQRTAIRLKVLLVAIFKLEIIKIKLSWNSRTWQLFLSFDSYLHLRFIWYFEYSWMVINPLSGGWQICWVFTPFTEEYFSFYKKKSLHFSTPLHLQLTISLIYFNIKIYYTKAKKEPWNIEEEVTNNKTLFSISIKKTTWHRVVLHFYIFSWRQEFVIVEFCLLFLECK